MSVIDELITDRTQGDLDTLMDLLRQDMTAWTETQKDWFRQAVSKGAYNYTDLNRVIAAMDYLDETFTRYGYETGYRKIFVRNTSGLPDGYTELEYLQSSGTQYIDTGVKPNQDTRTTTAILLLSEATSYVFGSRDSKANNYNNRYGILFNGKYRSDYGNGNGIIFSDSLTTGQKYSIDKNKNICSIGEETVTNQAAVFQSSFPMYISGVNEGGVASYLCSMRIYQFQVYNSGQKIREFVPVRAPNGSAGLYDLVEHRYYSNAGTGSFEEGPEVPVQPSDTKGPYTWYESDIPTAAHMERYIANVAALRGSITVLSTTPATPESMELLDYINANNIEKILVDINQLLINMAAAWFYSGEVYSGEVDA